MNDKTPIPKLNVGRLVFTQRDWSEPGTSPGDLPSPDVPSGEKRIYPGDYVMDKENPTAVGIVAKVTSDTADSHTFWKGGNEYTVAEVNEDYPHTDTVVEVRFIRDVEDSLQGNTYSYPKSRLRVLNSLAEFKNTL